MSYDLRIAVKVAGTDEDLYAVIAQPEYSSPTYNLRDMFVASMDWDYEQGVWYPVNDVYQKIVGGCIKLRYYPGQFKKYESPNGWGTTDSALRALESLKECIDEIENPDGWSGWNTIPKSLMYMSW